MTEGAETLDFRPLKAKHIRQNIEGRTSLASDGQIFLVDFAECPGRSSSREPEKGSDFGITETIDNVSFPNTCLDSNFKLIAGDTLGHQRVVEQLVDPEKRIDVVENRRCTDRREDNSCQDQQDG